MRAVAVVCARNEALHIRSALRDLIAEGLDVVLIDHASTDATAQIARTFLGWGLLDIVSMPWTGRFSLRQQLDMKHSVVQRLDHDWIVHVDADEWPSAPGPNQTLLDGLREADAARCNCVHFNEYVFVPRRGENLSGTDYRRSSTRYYFYRAKYPFLMRAWKNGFGLDNRAYAGHLLVGPTAARPYPVDFPLRHYIALSEEHARRKYVDRPFDEDELADGWHDDRVRAAREDLRLPADDEVHHLPDWSSKSFDVGDPRATHFWEWSGAARPYELVAV